jgi:hypothetical protein
MLTTRIRRDEGSITLLVIGYATILALLVVVGVDVSKAFLARRALSSVADAAALAAAQSLDRDAVYSGHGGGCGDLLPLDPEVTAQAVASTVDDDLADLRHTFAVVAPPETAVSGGSVTVHLAGDVAMPFGHALAILLPGHADGRVHIDVTSTAQSPVTTPGGC